MSETTDSERELIHLAKYEVPDSYKDFVLAVANSAVEIGKVEEMIAFIKENSPVTSSEVLMYLIELEDEDDHIREDLGLPPRWEEQ